MLRPALILAFLAVSFLGAQAQVRPHGPPASILSPNPDGSVTGPPASVNSPTPLHTRNGRVFVNGRSVRFGDPRRRHGRNEFVPVPIFIPAFDNFDGFISQADPPVDDLAATAEDDQAHSDMMRQAYNQGAHDALVRQQRQNRYGDHYLDSRDSKPSAADQKQARPEPKQANDEETAPAPEPDAPAAVFIFKDGHKLETQNYAIQGQTLFDFSTKPLRKIKLAELDLDATRKANDDMGINLRLP